MLVHLTIKNFALIDQLSVSFTNGFSIITGETGAGKSILLGGLSLILGNRADLSSITDTSKKCIVEAEFEISKYKLKSVFAKSDLDFENNTVIRREILPSGKSRAFINDTPVSLQILKTISSHLIDIHSQNQTLDLTSDAYQFEIIDALANSGSTLKEYTSHLKQYKKAKQELNDLIELQEKSNQSHDYNTFLLNELVEAKLDDINLEDLEQELEQLSNVETIKENLSHSSQVLSDEEIGILSLLNQVKSSSTAGKSVCKRLNSASIELDDLYGEIIGQQESLDLNPNRLVEITEIINFINNLFQKHQVTEIEALKLIRDNLNSSVSKIDNLGDEIKAKEESVKLIQNALLNIAQNLSEKRKHAIPKLVKQLEKILVNLGMENASFDVSLNVQDLFLDNGIDKLNFLFSANKGGQHNELKKAASGGELSRIMLAIKAILSKYKQLPTIMFDEIDTGVSGDIANKMALLMEYMSSNMQVFSITHLPQIASKGHSHFKVYKTKTNLKQLDSSERITEIAEMLGGKTITDSAINHAKELLNMKV